MFLTMRQIKKMLKVGDQVWVKAGWQWKLEKREVTKAGPKTVYLRHSLGFNERFNRDSPRISLTKKEGLDKLEKAIQGGIISLDKNRMELVTDLLKIRSQK